MEFEIDVSRLFSLTDEEAKISENFDGTLLNDLQLCSDLVHIWTTS